MAKLSETQIKNLLIEAVEAKKKGESLSSVFEKIAKKTGRAKGSIRNTYYNTLKQTQNDKGYREKMLGETQLKAVKAVAFKDEESDFILKKILLGVTFGKSVRRAISEISDDPKTALRYQNKYRNLLKYDGERVDRIRQEIKAEYGRCHDPVKRGDKPESDILKLRKEINSLCDRITQNIKFENAELKLMLKKYRDENLKLKALLDGKTSSTAEYFLHDKLVNQIK